MEAIDLSDPLKTAYEYCCQTPSDINEHLPLLFELAQNSRSVVEFGVRTGVSTTAFLYAATRKGGPSVRSYDVTMETNIPTLFKMAVNEGADAEFIQANSLSVTIEETDTLMIDSDHRYEHLLAELERHAPKVRRYIAMHDTKTMGLGAWDTEPQGLLSAILHFLIAHPEWNVFYHTIANNGLTVLKRSYWYES